MKERLENCSIKGLIFLTSLEFALIVLLIYLTYTLPLLWKLLTAIFAIFLLFLFLSTISVTFTKTSLVKKKFSIWLVLFIPLIIYFISSYFLGSIEVLLLVPISLILVYWTFIIENYINPRPIDNDATRLCLRSLRENLQQLSSLFSILLVVSAIVFIIFIRGLLSIPNTFQDLYNVSLTVYTVIFSVATAFGVLALDSNDRSIRNSYLRRPLLGLAQMCVLFFFISLVGLIIGNKIDSTVFASGMTLEKAFTLDTLGIGVIRILFMEGVIISFPISLIYMYSILKTYLLDP